MLDKLKEVVLFFLKRIHRGNKSRLLNPPQKILILQLNQLGDTLVFTPALRALRKTYPDALIDILTNDVTYEIYRYCPYVNWLWKVANPLVSLKTLSILRKIRKEKYDITLLDAGQRALRFSLVSYFIGYHERAGFDWNGRGFHNTINVPFEEKHFIDCNLNLIRALGAQPDGDRMEIWYTEEDSRQVERLLEERGISENNFLISINVSSKEPAKFWITERWAQLADLLIEKLYAKVVFTGLPKDQKLVRPIIDRMSYKAASFVGKTTLHQLAALLQRSHLCITVDSGSLHIATAVGTPLVALMSGRNYPYEWDPKTKKSKVIRKKVPCNGCRKVVCPFQHHPCMSLISVDDVTDAVRDVYYPFSSS